MHDQQFAQDLAQSVLARLILCRNRVQNVGAWLRVALRHLAFAERKRRAAHGAEVPAEEWNLPAVEPDCDLHLHVREVLGALPPREAKILTMAARGASHCEIAELIGCRTRDVGSLLARAQAKARRKRAR